MIFHDRLNLRNLGVCQNPKRILPLPAAQAVVPTILLQKRRGGCWRHI